MSLPALMPPSQSGDSKVYHLDPQRRVAELEEELRAAREKIASLELAEKAHVLQNGLLSFGICLVARKYFSSDDLARLYAVANGNNCDEASARKHWRKNGGKESFKRHFPTAVHVIRHCIPSPLARAIIRRMAEKATR